MPRTPTLTKNDVERLSHGQFTRAKRGSRDVGHRLTQKERVLFEAAKRNGVLKLPLSGLRPNVVRIYQLWCEAAGVPCVILGHERELGEAKMVP
jgi:hypothetical protein